MPGIDGGVASNVVSVDDGLASNRPQRVVIAVGVNYLDGGGGAARIAWDEARYLATLGHEVWMVGHTPSEAAPEYQVVDGVHVLRYHLKRLSRFDPRSPWRHQLSFKSLLRRYVPEPVDFVHGHQPIQSYAAGRYFGRGARFGYTLHSPVVPELKASHAARKGIAALVFEGKLALLNRYEHSVLARADRITVLSEYSRSLIRQIHGERIAAKVEVVPGWVDFDRFLIIADREEMKRQLNWPLDMPVLLTVRRLVRRMGLDRLLRAMRACFDAGHRFHLVIGGSGPWRASLQELAETLGLSHNVTFAGYVQDDLLPAMYGACDAFVLPTAELECFGLIAIEALACGRPVLATPVGAIRELLANFEPAWLASAADENAIAEVLKRFLTNRVPSHEPEELRALARGGYSASVHLPAMAAMFGVKHEGSQ